MGFDVTTMLQLFYEGGCGFMTLLTINLIVLIFAIWKVPRIVKPLGVLPLGYTLLYQSVGLAQVFDSGQAAGGFSQMVWCGGLKVLMIPIVYAALIFTISIIADIIITLRKK